MTEDFWQEINEEISNKNKELANFLKKFAIKQKRKGKLDNYLICQEIITKAEKTARKYQGENTDTSMSQDIAETLF